MFKKAVSALGFCGFCFFKFLDIVFNRSLERSDFFFAIGNEGVLISFDFLFFCFFKLKVCAGVAFLLFFSDSQELVPLILLGWGLLLGTMALTSENDVLNLKIL